MAETLNPSMIVVDDDADMVNLIGGVAQSVGFDVRTAANADGFMALYNENEPSLIVMDIVMPDIDGIELVKRLVKRNCIIPIVLISGYGGRYLNIASHLASKQGIDIVGTLTKPFDIEDLQALMKQVFDTREA